MNHNEMIFLAVLLFVFLSAIVLLIHSQQAQNAYRERQRMIRYLEALKNQITACTTVLQDRKLIIERLEIMVKYHFATDEFTLIKKSLTDEYYESLHIEEKELHRFAFKLSKGSLQKNYQNLHAWLEDPDNRYHIHKAIAWYQRTLRPQQKKFKKSEKKVNRINKKLSKAYQFMARPPQMTLDKSIKTTKEMLEKWLVFYQKIDIPAKMPIAFLSDQPKEPNFPQQIGKDASELLNTLKEAQKPMDNKKKAKAEKKQRKLDKKKEQQTQKKARKAAKKEQATNDKTDHQHPSEEHASQQQHKKEQQKKKSKNQKDNNQSNDKPVEKETKATDKKKEAAPSREERTAALGMGEPNQ